MEEDSKPYTLEQFHQDLREEFNQRAEERVDTLNDGNALKFNWLDGYLNGIIYAVRKSERL